MEKADCRLLDKFYTRPEIVAQCLRQLFKDLQKEDIDDVDLWLEPSAGSGAFLSKLPTPRLGLDLAPEAAGIERADFLCWTPSVPSQRIATVGNPPFGKNASKAIAFFNHAATFSTIIAMVFPRTFEKSSVHRRLDRNFRCVSNMPLPKNAFTFMGADASVPCTFQVLIKAETPRDIAPTKTTHADFRFLQDRSGAEMAFQRIGANAGTIKTSFQHLSASSHFFIKASSHIPAADLEQRFRSLDFERVKHLTAGNPSIAKSELIAIYEAAFGQDGGATLTRDDVGTRVLQQFRRSAGCNTAPEFGRIA